MSTVVLPIDQARERLSIGMPCDAVIDSYFDRCDCMNDLILLGKGRAGCVKCGNNAEVGKQLWRCSCCGTCRVWGLDFPFSVDPAKLNCTVCGTVRSHRFMIVTRAR
jgi:hypothetical protein